MSTAAWGKEKSLLQSTDRGQCHSEPSRRREGESNQERWEADRGMDGWCETQEGQRGAGYITLAGGNTKSGSISALRWHAAARSVVFLWTIGSVWLGTSLSSVCGRCPYWQAEFMCPWFAESSIKWQDWDPLRSSDRANLKLFTHLRKEIVALQVGTGLTPECWWWQMLLL